MEYVSEEIFLKAVEILGLSDITDEEERLQALVKGDITVRRLMDIIPEAFGLVVISHLAPSGSISLPDTFSVQSANGDWQTVPIKDEPIFTAALLIAQNMFHNGPRECFKNISYRSALLDAVNNALNKADSNLASLEGSTLSGPNFFGIPAEIYE